MLEIFFTMEGSFGLYHPTLKIKGKYAMEQPAILMPRYSVYGEYQLLFDLYPRMELASMRLLLTKLSIFYLNWILKMMKDYLYSTKLQTSPSTANLMEM